MEELNKESITIINGKSEVIKEFLLNDERLLNEYFIFNIRFYDISFNEFMNLVWNI